jgi:hypothetical protein
MTTLALALALASMLALAHNVAGSFLALASFLATSLTASRRPRNYDEWALLTDDAEMSEAWPVELTAPNPAAKRDIPIHAQTAWDAAGMFLAARRDAMGETNKEDEQLYLIEMVAFLRACGHGEVDRERGTERATPVVSAYKRGPTLPCNVDVYAVTVAL